MTNTLLKSVFPTSNREIQSTIPGDDSDTNNPRLDEASTEILRSIHEKLIHEMKQHEPQHSEASSSKSKSWLPRISPTPILIQEMEFRKQLQLQESLAVGILTGLQLWWKKDPRICKVLRIPSKVETLLREMIPADSPVLSDKSSIGCYRPDILYDEEQVMKLCEINARFTLNGYLMTTFLASAAQNGVFEKLSNTQNAYTAVPPTQAFTRVLKQRLLKAAVDGCASETTSLPTIWVISDREPAHDLIWLASICQGVAHIRNATSKQLRVDVIDKQLKVGDEVVTSCILELHQDELMQLEDDVLRQLIQLSMTHACLNPIWSIFIVHDKKFLSVLRQLKTEDIHTSFANAQLHIQTLNKHIIPTYVTNLAGLDQMLDTGINQLLGASLLVKPPLLGKGEGIIFQKNCSDEKDFLQQVQNAMKHNVLPNYISDENFVVQPYIQQARFQIASEPQTIVNTSEVQVDVQHWHTVGTLLCMDGDYFGPGIFRFSSQDLIALVSGGIAGVPVFEIQHLSHDLIQHGSSLNEIITETSPSLVVKDLRKNMVEYGIAMLTLQSNQLNGTKLGEFLEDQFEAKLQEPCPGKGAVWVVSPMNAGIARSHQSDEFATHTDASFETNPPRYFALGVQSVDKRGGGWSGFARIRDAVNQLSLEEYVILRRTKVRWEVPIEFRVDPSVEKHIFAPVLMSKNRGRVRSDVMDLSHLSEAIKLQFQHAYDKFYNFLTASCRKSSFLLPEGSIMFIDNQRFVHCRTAIQDQTRSLVRIRFDLAVPSEVECIQANTCFSNMPITRKMGLMKQIESDFPNRYLEQGGLYWSPSGGTSSGSAGAETCAIPSSNTENNELRIQLAEQLRIFGAFQPSSVVANLMACGNLYRSMEIFTDIAVYNGCSNLPIGPDVDDEAVLNMMRYFGVNSLCGWPSRLLKLITYARSHAHGKEILAKVHTIVHGGEVLSPMRRNMMLDICAPHCRIYGVFGSAEVGVFACTDGSESQSDVYYPVPDIEHIEVVDDDGKHLPTGETGLIVATNLLRKSQQPIVRYCMDDQGQLLDSDDGIVRLRVLGRSETGISFPLGPIFLYWNDMQRQIFSLFEAISPQSTVVGQIWIASDALAKDQLMIVVYMEHRHEVNSDVLHDVEEKAKDAMMKYVAEVPNVVSVCVKYVDSMSELQYSSRSSKIMYFVDTRSKP